MKAVLRVCIAAIAGVSVLLLANRLGMAWLHDTAIEEDHIYDGFALILTLLLPSLLGGLALGLVARAHALPAAALTFLVFTVAGLFHPFWIIPAVTTRSTHSGLMHYFLYNPIVVLAFGVLGAWFGGQFSTGRFVLADRQPVHMPGLED